MNEIEHDRWRDELAAYLLGALEPGEAAGLERHVAGCEDCRQELDWLRPAVHLLPEAVERHEPPPQRRRRLFEQVREEAGTTRPRGGLHSLRGGWPSGLALRPLAGLAALVLVVAGVAVYAAGGGSGGGGAGGTTTVAAGHSPGVTAQVVRQDGSGTLRLANLHKLPRDEVLQAWVRRGQRVVSAKALFVPNPDGTATATIDDMQGVNAVMVTAEPRGGSVQPTSAPIVSVPIPN
jgi:anti-sigma-K factor RskA